ncbi:hypothetical protein D3C84_1103450 [compost metagenome]
MGFFPFIAQTHGLADDFLQTLGAHGLRLELFHFAADVLEGGAERRIDGATNHQPEREFICHAFHLRATGWAQSVSHQTISENDSP